MSATQGTSGFGTLLKRGDGGVGAGTKASLTKGTTDSQIVIRWGTAGTAGNGKTVTIVESGTNTPLSVSVTTTDITINLETDGVGDSASTVNDVIAALYANETFRTYWEADDGVGDGTGILAAAATDTLAGGAAGAEVFTTVAEVTNISGPDESLELIDATHMESPGSRREFIPSLLDSGEITLDLNFLPSDANQNGLREDLNNRVRRNFQIVWTDDEETTYSFAGYVTSHSKTAQIDDKLSASVTIKITGDITVS